MATNAVSAKTKEELMLLAQYMLVRLEEGFTVQKKRWSNVKLRESDGGSAPWLAVVSSGNFI